MRFSLGVLGTACVAALAFSCTDATVDVPTQEQPDASPATTDAGKQHDGGSSAEAGNGGDDDDDDDDASTTFDGGAEAGTPPGGTSDVSLIVEPSDKGAAFLDAVKAAKSSVHMTMYLLTDSTLISELTALAPKIPVQVVLNQNFPSSGSDSGSNTDAYNTLTKAGVSTVYAPSTFTYTHEKAVIIDGTQLWILTMNATYSGRTSNREYLVTDTDPADVAEADAIFKADFAGTSISNPTGKLLVSPVSMRNGLYQLIDSATSTLEFEVEEFYDTGMASAFCTAAGRGVKVRGVVADLGQASSDTPWPTLSKCGVSFVQLDTPYVHAKAIIADGKTAYVGSANFSSTSLDHNRELGGILDDATAVKSVATTVSGDIGNGSSF